MRSWARSYVESIFYNPPTPPRQRLFFERKLCQTKIHKVVRTMQIGWQERPGQKLLLRHQGCSEALTSLKTLVSMEFSRSLSSKRSSAAIELCPSESLPFTQLLGMQ